MSLSKPEEQLAYELSCPICLQLFSDPLVLPCGHNYCRSCIGKSVDIKDQTPPRCPECREEYQGFESLQRNFKLCSIIEGYRATAPQLDWQLDTVEGEVFCDHCIDEQLAAVKTCLKCEVSLCSRHLQRHNEKEAFRAHAVVEPLKELGMKACATHRRPFEYFCSNDMTLMCSTCFIEGHHYDHDVLTFSAAEQEMRAALESRSKVVLSFMFTRGEIFVPFFIVASVLQTLRKLGLWDRVKNRVKSNTFTLNVFFTITFFSRKYLLYVN